MRHCSMMLGGLGLRVTRLLYDLTFIHPAAPVSNHGKVARMSIPWSMI